MVGSWQDVADTINRELNTSYTESKFRKSYQCFQNMFDSNKKKFVDCADVLNELELKKIEIQKEKQKLFEQREALNRIIRNQAYNEDVYELINNAIILKKIPQLTYSGYDAIKSGKDMLCSLTDIHNGADISNAWNEYNPEKCSQYLSQYAIEIIKYGEEHHCEDCYVWNNGDSINGSIHKKVRIENKENIIYQLMQVSELVAQFLSKISPHFNNVFYMDIAGNHTRLDKKDDAVDSERLDDLVSWWLKPRLSAFENIVFPYNRIDNTMYMQNIRGLNYLGVHGDIDDKKSVLKTASMVHGITVYGILCGHKHHNSFDTVNGIKVIMGGSFLGTNEYCIDNRIYGVPQQIICTCDEHGANDFHEVNFI